MPTAYPPLRFFPRVLVGPAELRLQNKLFMINTIKTNQALVVCWFVSLDLVRRARINLSRAFCTGPRRPCRTAAPPRCAGRPPGRWPDPGGGMCLSFQFVVFVINICSDLYRCMFITGQKIAHKKPTSQNSLWNLV